MKAAEFTLHRPHRIEEAVDLLAHHGEDAKVLAGGQSLLPIMNMRLAEPAHLIDITGIDALHEVAESPASITYGALTPHMAFEHGLVADAAGGLLRTAAAGIGYPAIRNRGTLGGSVAHADSSAEWPVVLSALGATVHTVSPRGPAVIGVRDLIVGFFTTALAPDEIIVAVEVPRLPAGSRWGFHKTARKPGEFAQSIAVAVHRPDSEQLWLGAAGDTPIRIHPDSDPLEAIGHHGDYTRAIHAVTVRRALEATREAHA
ncbi:FAD binding domain-containing protein [Amycolatopsis taiwanensis]|uniref:FAD-binding PCMH-type domain-containing protein n=1 Tax=Amycolatopsis taiwanensis TaxID=342230 RepID=A0A9W6R2V2_9PSEU|nr:FAD binding domain-containing protein [Amycolatopsis taiwanensis]GLY68129.1 hypothetical protein Atai01_47480 [Amycolatopsis taiwanensis]